MHQTIVPVPMLDIERRIITVRGQRVMIDSDLAMLFGVPTKVLNQAVKRNLKRFPSDFMFQLSEQEKYEVVTNCDHLTKLKFSKTLPFAFTEHGTIQAANVLSSDVAIEMGVYIVRAFVNMRELLFAQADLVHRLNALESKADLIEVKHESFEHNTRVQLKQIIEALRELSAQPKQVKKRPIGFVSSEDDPQK